MTIPGTTRSPMECGAAHPFVLGPMAGVQTFDLYEGNRVIGHIRATVRTDHTTPLILPR